MKAIIPTILKGSVFLFGFIYFYPPLFQCIILIFLDSPNDGPVNQNPQNQNQNGLRDGNGGGKR
jgi:hypothetical protein